MVVVRPVRSLAKRMGIQLQQSDTKSTTALGDWHAMDVVIERRQYILCTSEHGRLPVLLKAAPYAEFPTRLAAALPFILVGLGIPAQKASTETEPMAEIILAKTNNRSILGSMKQFRIFIGGMIEVGQFSHNPLAVSLELAAMLSMALPEYRPIDAVRGIFGEPPAPWPTFGF